MKIKADAMIRKDVQKQEIAKIKEWLNLQKSSFDMT
jgi:hypothetical protein